MEEEQEVQSSKHVCKICNRRFSCGRALGGHMRIHGSLFSAADEDDGIRRRRFCATESKNGLREEQEQEASCGGDHLESKNNNPMYDLRPNRRRTWRYADLDYSFAAVNGEFGSSKFSVLKNSQACGQCGEEFSSWNTLIRHMEFHFDDNKVEQPEEEEEEEEQSEDDEEEEVGLYWDSESDTERVRERINRTKGKRSNRTQRRPSPSSEVEFMANCLVMLASSGESWEPTIKPSSSFNRLDDECTTSGVRDLKRKRRPPLNLPQDLKKLVPKKMKYECKTCKKMFSSFQALGGHRASHNKVKGCSAKQDDDLDEEIITSDEDLSKDLGKSTTAPPLCDEEESIVLGSVICSSKQKSPWLDLNLPAPDDEPKWFHSTQKQQGLCSIPTQR